MFKIECLNDEPLDYLDIKANVRHTHMVNVQDPGTGIKNQGPVSIYNDMTGEQAKMQNNSVAR